LIGYAAQVRLRVGALLHSNSNANISVTTISSSLGNSSRAQERAEVMIIIMVGMSNYTLQGVIETIY